MRIIRIGRDTSNDYIIEHPAVSGFHADLYVYDNGAMQLVEHSTNGTYVNNNFVHNSTCLLHVNDVLVFPDQRPTYVYNLLSVEVKADTEKPEDLEDYSLDNSDTYVDFYHDRKTKVGPLGIIALVTSIIAVAILAFCAVKIMQWGIFALATRTSMIITAGVISLISLILAHISSDTEDTDSPAASIAEWLSGACLTAIIMFYVYLKIDPNALNPFKDLNL